MRTDLPHKLNVSLRLPRPLHDELHREATNQELSFCEYIHIILLARQKPERAAA
jgi:hypothetical protein